MSAARTDFERRILKLSKPEANKAIEFGKSAFPKFTDWEFEEKGAEPGFGFSMWGEYIPDGDDKLSPRRFFVTFDTYLNDWQGHLTIGKRSYIWTSPKAGDAWLVQTRSCDSLEEAVEALRAEIAKLVGVILATS